MHFGAQYCEALCVRQSNGPSEPGQLMHARKPPVRGLATRVRRSLGLSTALIYNHYVGLRQQRPPDDVMLGFPLLGDR